MVARTKSYDEELETLNTIDCFGDEIPVKKVYRPILKKAENAKKPHEKVHKKKTRKVTVREETPPKVVDANVTTEMHGLGDESKEVEIIEQAEQPLPVSEKTKGYDLTDLNEVINMTL